SPGVPTGHTGNGVLANPPVRRLKRSLNLETADQAANSWATSHFGAANPGGVGYFLNNHNDNATGIKYLAQVTTSGAQHFGQIRELSGPNIVQNPNNSSSYVLNVAKPSNNVLTGTYGMTSNETFFGVRIYPGNYYITQFAQSQQDAVYIRSYGDGEGPGKDIN